MSKAQRTKGAVWEREVARRFAEALPNSGAKRGLGQARSASEVADVDVPCFWVEAKHHKLVRPGAALDQAVEASEGSTKWPVAIIKQNRREPFVCMRLDDFLDLAGEWWERR